MTLKIASRGDSITARRGSQFGGLITFSIEVALVTPPYGDELVRASGNGARFRAGGPAPRCFLVRSHGYCPPGHSHCISTGGFMATQYDVGMMRGRKTYPLLAAGLTERPLVMGTPLEEFFTFVVPSQDIKRREVPDNLVGAMLYFSSGESSFTTGQTLQVNGGVSRS